MKTFLSFVFATLACFSLNAQNGCPYAPPTPGNSGTIDTALPPSRSLTQDTGIGGFSDQLSYSMSAVLSQGGAGLSVSQANKLAYEQIDGSPYLNDEPSKGTLVLTDGRVVEDVMLQIDLYTNKVIAHVNEDEEIVLNSHYFSEVIISHEGQDLVFQRINPDEPNKFYEVLYDDNGMVFFKERYVTKSEALNNGIAQRDEKFNQRNNYFIGHQEGQIAKVNLRKKDMFSGFIDDEVYSMIAYAKKKGIKLKNEQDYVRVFQALAAN